MALLVAASGADGRYRLSLSPGDYHPFARHEAYTPESASLLVADSPATCDFVLVPGGTIRGQVIARDTGQPVPGADVEASGGWLMHKTSTTVTADENGMFVADEVGPGTIALVAASTGYASGGPTFVDHASGEQTDKVRLVVDRAFAIRGRVDGEGLGVEVSAMRM